MQLSNPYKVKGSSIMESVIAMTIIAICLSIGIIIYGRVLQTDNNMAYYQAQQKMKELLWEIKNNRDFENDEYKLETYTIEKKVEILEGETAAQITFVLNLQNRKKEYHYIVSY